jgi:Zn-dependent protease
MYRYSQKITFSAIEIRDLVKSLLVIGLAFTIVSTGLSFNLLFLTTLLISILTAGLAFLLHELAHKIVAQRYGCWSEYRADSTMLVFTLLLSFMGVVFAAPGAVFINGSLTKKEYGKISAAGPLTNIFLAIISLGIFILSPAGVLGTIAAIGATINSWIALFNMIPFGNFDGLKIWGWSKLAYFSMIAAAFGLMLLSSR